MLALPSWPAKGYFSGVQAIFSRLQASVGQRVVVRLRTADGATDVVGVLRRFDADAALICTHENRLIEFTPAMVITGKPVPPRGSVRQRLGDAEVQRRVSLGWRAELENGLGDWLLRSAGGFSHRANSVRVGPDPGTDFASALRRVEHFYAEAGQPALAQLPSRSPYVAEFEAAGWIPSPTHPWQTEVQLTSLAMLSRRLSSTATPPTAPVWLSDRADPGWLKGDPHLLAAGSTAVGVLERCDEVAFARIGDLAWGRASLAEDWAGFTNLLVAPSARRRGMASQIMAALAEWAAERGASTAYLQVVADNRPAYALYEKLGFRVHHSYRYLTAG